jgi:hypothetical protein
MFHPIRPWLPSTPNAPAPASSQASGADTDGWVYLPAPSVRSPYLGPVSDGVLPSVPAFSPLAARSPASPSPAPRSRAETPSPVSERELAELEAFIAQLQALLAPGPGPRDGARQSAATTSQVATPVEAKPTGPAPAVKAPQITGPACIRLGLRGAPTTNPWLLSPWARRPLQRLADTANAAHGTATVGNDMSRADKARRSAPANR